MTLAKGVQDNADDIDSLYSIASDNDNALEILNKKVFDSGKDRKNKR